MPEISPLAPEPKVLSFLSKRRSRPAKSLKGPGPDAAALRDLLEIAARVPDHGKLEPWRFIVLGSERRLKLGSLVAELGPAYGLEPEKVAKARAMFDDAPSMVAVVAQPVDSPKIPEVEQTLSAGAVCYGLLMAALAGGWGANWLTGWMAFDRSFLTRGLDLAETEWVAGWIVIGTEGAVPPDRPRPDLDTKIEWRDA